MMKKKTMYIVLVTLVILNVFCLFFISGKVSIRKELVTKEHKAKDVLEMVKSEQEQKEVEVENQLFKQTFDKLNPKIETIAVFNSEVQLLNTISENFFKDYFTWNNSEEYHERKEKMVSYVSEELIENKSIFDEGLDDTGEDYIKGTGLKSKFNKSKGYLKSDSKRNGEVIEGIVEVEYESWFDDNKQKSISSKIYEFSFNKKENEVKNISILVNYK